MAHSLLSVTVLALLAGCAAGASIVPSFAFGYTGPDGGVVSQSFSGPSDALAYQYQYKYPGQQHDEKKTHDGQVKGHYSFKDANGVVQDVNYQAAPGVGFNVETADEARSGVVLSATQSDAGFDPTFAAYHPHLGDHVKSGQLERSTQADGAQVYTVSKGLVEQAKGSTSQLAYNLGVDLPAARHDPQVRAHPGTPYTRQAEDDNRPVLEQVRGIDGEPKFVVKIYRKF